MSTKHLVFTCIVLICLVLVQGCAGILRSHKKAKVHGDKQDCGICHTLHKMKVATLLKKPVSELCFECHEDRKAASEHVVDVVPSMQVKDLLLTDGKMTCVTCHDSHKNTHKAMLRVTPEDLCQRCHLY